MWFADIYTFESFFVAVSYIHIKLFGCDQVTVANCPSGSLPYKLHWWSSVAEDKLFCAPSPVMMFLAIH